MKNILVAGSGKIGSLISQLLASVDDYFVYLIDTNEQALSKIQVHDHLITKSVDVSRENELREFIVAKKIHTVVACLPYFCNEKLLLQAVDLKLNYFDLTEDVFVAEQVKKHAAKTDTVFMPRCGVAPGLVNIMAKDLMDEFDTLNTVKLRAGCLPKNVSNPLQYALAWSVDGLINEYGNVGYGIYEGNKVELQPLDDIETVELDGITYEAFNTSGGVGALVEMFEGKVDVLNYKTLRYQGHCEKMRFLMRDLHLNEDRETLKQILTRALPQTNQDVMIVYVSVSGEVDGDYIERNNMKKFYPKELFGHHRSAIQVTTACSATAVIDIIHKNIGRYRGFVNQESMVLNDVIENRFGQMMIGNAG